MVHAETQLEMDKLLPELMQLREDKKKLNNDLNRVMKDKRNTEALMKKSEEQNQRFMLEYCHDRKMHNELIVKKTKEANIQDLTEAHELSLTIARQQNQLERFQLQSKILQEEHDCYADYVNDLER